MVASKEGEEKSVLGNVFIFYEERISTYNLYHYIVFNEINSRCIRGIKEKRKLEQRAATQNGSLSESLGLSSAKQCRPVTARA